MIDELVLEQLLDEIAQEIAVPADGAERVVHELGVSVREARRPAPRLLMAAAAVVVVVGGIGVLMHTSGTSSSKTAAAPALTPPNNDLGASVNGGAVVAGAGIPAATGAQGQSITGPIGNPGVIGVQGPPGVAGPAGPVGQHGAKGPAGVTLAAPSSPAGTVDGALVVRTGTLQLQMPHGDLHSAVTAVAGVANRLGGYVSTSNASYDGTDPNGEVTIRVPVGNYDTAVSSIKGLSGANVIGDSETGHDVTAQVTNLQAQLTAENTEQQALLTVLSSATNVGDILSVQDRISAVDATINQIQGQINLATNQAQLSSISVSLTEKPLPVHHKPTPAAHHAAKPPTGLSKAWQDSRQGFANSVEWFIARSGGTLIVLLAALIFLFGIRYLYPLVRRGLL